LKYLLILAALLSCSIAQDLARDPWSTAWSVNHGPKFKVEVDSASSIDFWVKCNIPTPCLAAAPVDQELRFFAQVGEPVFSEGWQTVHYQITFPAQQASESILATVEHAGKHFTYLYKVEGWF